eukprot:g650.t1
MRADNNHERVFRETKAYAADEDFFQVLDYGLLAGDPQTALVEPASVVLPRSAAVRYFGEEAVANGEVLGRQLLGGKDAGTPWNITGIMEDQPENSHLQFDMLVSARTYPDDLYSNQVWSWNIMHTYLRTKAHSGSERVQLQAKLKQIAETYTLPNMPFAEASPEQMASVDFNYLLQPITDIHLKSNYLREMRPNGNATYVKLFLWAAYLVLFMAIINFINLATAQATRRASETGVRKILGASYRSLIQQHLTESLATGLLTDAFKAELASHPGIATVGFSNGLPGQSRYQMRNFRAEGKDDGIGLNWILADDTFLPTLGMELKAGRNFQLRNSVDSMGVILNEAAVKTLDLENPVGHMLIKNEGRDDEERVQVIGVVKDFHLQSLHDEIQPLAFCFFKDFVFKDYISVRLSGNDVNGAIAHIEQRWEAFEPGVPLRYSFLDENYNQLFASEVQLGRLFRVFTGLAILIAGLGLFGLVSLLLAERIRLAAALALLLYVQKEYAFDRFHTNADRICRVNLAVSYDGSSEKWASAPNITGPALAEAIPEVEEYVRFLHHNFGRTASVAFGEKRLKEERLFWADSTVTTVFDIPIVKGDQRTPLDRPGTAMINERTAERIFGSENPIGGIVEGYAMHLGDARQVRMIGILALVVLLLACFNYINLTTARSQRRLREVGISKAVGASSGHMVTRFLTETALLSGVALVLALVLMIILATVLAVPIGWWVMAQWLSNFAYRISINWWVFGLAGGLALLIAILTIAGQSWRAATRNPVDALRNE